MAQESNDASGKTATQPVATANVLPGVEVIYSITVSNDCSRPVSDVVVDKLVPENMNYLKGTAKGDGTDRIFSVDGRNFARFDNLRVQHSDGTWHTASAEDVKAIRWIFNASINPDQHSVIQFHARKTL
jgi:uncharacterized repeat protein (TIGR01451 family)